MYTSKLITYIESKNTESALEQIRQNNNINTPDYNGNTPLILASRYGNTDIVNALLSTPQIDINHANRFGSTALIAATRNGHIEIATNLLQRQDIDIHKTDLSKRTALMFASAYGHATIAKTLIEKNAELNNLDKNGNTALMFASYNGRTAIVQDLLTHQDTLVVNHANHDGRSALTLARHKRRAAITKLIKPIWTDKNNKTMMELKGIIDNFKLPENNTLSWFMAQLPDINRCTTLLASKENKEDRAKTRRMIVNALSDNVDNLLNIYSDTATLQQNETCLTQIKTDLKCIQGKGSAMLGQEEAKQAMVDIVELIGQIRQKKQLNAINNLNEIISFLAKNTLNEKNKIPDSIMNLLLTQNNRTATSDPRETLKNLKPLQRETLKLNLFTHIKTALGENQDWAANHPWISSFIEQSSVNKKDIPLFEILKTSTQRSMFNYPTGTWAKLMECIPRDRLIQANGNNPGP